MEKIGLLILFLIVNINPLWAEEANTTAVKEHVSKIEINYEKDLLSVTARSVNLKELFEEIAKKTKIEVVLDKEAGEQKISVEFKQLSLKEGIEKIIDLTGLKDLAIDYMKKEGKYEISKVEIRRHSKADVIKAEKTYINKKYRFKINYPVGFEVVESPLNVYPDIVSVEISFYGLSKQKEFSIRIYSKDDEGMIRESLFIISEDKVIVDSIEGIMLNGTGQKDGTPLVNIVLVKNNTYLYVFEGERDLLDKMLLSFKFTQE